MFSLIVVFLFFPCADTKPLRAEHTSGDADGLRAMFRCAEFVNLLVLASMNVCFVWESFGNLCVPWSYLYTFLWTNKEFFFSFVVLIRLFWNDVPSHKLEKKTCIQMNEIYYVYFFQSSVAGALVHGPVGLRCHLDSLALRVVCYQSTHTLGYFFCFFYCVDACLNEQLLMKL